MARAFLLMFLYEFKDRIAGVDYIRPLQGISAYDGDYARSIPALQQPTFKRAMLIYSARCSCLIIEETTPIPAVACYFDQFDRG